MEASVLLRWLLSGGLLLFFLLPILNLLRFFNLWSQPFGIELWQALLGGTIQSLLSTVVTFVFGLVGAWGLLAWRWRHRKTFDGLRALVLLPSFLPPLIVVVLTATSLSHLPLNLLGIVFFHSLMNVGLAAVIIELVIYKKAGGWIEKASIENVGALRFIWRGLIPNLTKEFLLILGFLFLLFFTSFSIPFLVGGGRFAGMEVFIYETIFLYRDWGQALSLSLILLLPLLLLGFLVARHQGPENRSLTTGRAFPMASMRCLWPLILPLLLLLVGFLQAAPSLLDDPFAELVPLMRGSVLLGLLTGLSTLVVFTVLLYCNLSRSLARALFFLVPPSWMIIAFSFFLLDGDGVAFQFAKSSAAMVIIFTPFLYRLGFYQERLDLQDQVELAQVMGQGWDKIFFWLVLPQMLPSMAFLAGVAAVWAAGDFAVSSVLFSGDMTLALAMKSLLMNYRLSLAHQLVVPLILVLALLFSFFQGLAYVARRIHF